MKKEWRRDRAVGKNCPFLYPVEMKRVLLILISLLLVSCSSLRVQDYMDNRTPVYLTQTSLSPQEFVDCMNSNQPPEFVRGPFNVNSRFVPPEEAGVLERVINPQLYWNSPTKISDDSVAIYPLNTQFAAIIIEGNSVEWYHFMGELIDYWAYYYEHYQKVCG